MYISSQRYVESYMCTCGKQYFLYACIYIYMHAFLYVSNYLYIIYVYTGWTKVLLLELVSEFDYDENPFPLAS